MQRTDASAVLQIFTEADVWSSLDEWECQCVQKEVTFRHLNVCVQDQYIFHLCNFTNIKHQIFLPFIRITAHYSISWTHWHEEGEKYGWRIKLTILPRNNWTTLGNFALCYPEESLWLSKYWLIWKWIKAKLIKQGLYTCIFLYSSIFCRKGTFFKVTP